MLGFDLETYPIGPRKAPKVIVGAMNLRTTDADTFQVDSWATKVKVLEEDTRRVYFFSADNLSDFLTLCERVDCPIVAHNGAYDWSCISAMDASFIPRIFNLFKTWRVQCTYIRTLISLNAYGQLKAYSNKKLELAHGKYGLTSLVGACQFFCNLDLSEAKDHDVQVTYYKVEGLPPSEWPEAYREYLIQDVEHLHTLFMAQESKGLVHLRQQRRKVNIFDEAPRRSAFHYALTLASAWGMRVNPYSVAELRQQAEDEVRIVADELIEAGLAQELEGREREKAEAKGKLTIRLDQKKLRERVKTAFKAQGKEPPMTAKDLVSTSRSVLVSCGDELLERWAKVGDKKTIWSTFVPALEKSLETNNVINTSFFPYSETGRISARNPNLLNPPRSGGIRECLEAREGCCFIFCDYEANELRVLSQVLLDEFNRSRLANLYIEDPYFDPHTYMACQKLNIPYEEGKKRKSAGDKEFKSMRQLMKCCNFGFPGGMASKTFIEFAKGYNVAVTEEEAEDLKTFFFSQFPEIKDYLSRVGQTVNSYDGQGYLHRVGRLSGDRRFCQLANFYFQGLAAEGGLTAFTRVSEAAYCDPTSPLYGTRPVLFVHDEIIVETPIYKAHEAAMELQRLMEESMGIYTPNIPSVAEPTLAVRWWKDAYQKFDENGRLVPSDID